MATVFIGMPLYNGTAHVAAIVRGFVTPSKIHRYSAKPMGTSLIPDNCNKLYCEALNRRADWYAQLHSDIEPPDGWVDTLIDEAEKFGADFVSAVVPIKERAGRDSGSTSTAIAHTADPFRIHCRLTLAQILHPAFPQTFDIHGAVNALLELPDALRVTDAPRSYLLANTGCMVVRLNREWSGNACFSNPCQIEKMGSEYKPAQRPEDWFFTSRIAELGGKVMATKAVRVKHWGMEAFDSHEVWGKARDV